MPMRSLRDLQTRFFDSLNRAPGAGPVSFDPVFVDCVDGRGRLGAEDRVDIYAQMYYARLVDVLKSDFPRVAAILACDRFHEVVSAYLTRHPSTHPSLRYLGRCFPAFLQDRPEIADFPFLADLAALEWARGEVFDAPDVEPLRLTELQHIAPDDWPTLKFQVVPAFRLVHGEWPVQEIWKAAEADEPTLEGVCPEQSVLRVWRNGFSVYHVKIDAVEYTALARILAGEPFASVCEALEELLPTEEATSAVGGLLLRWIEDGVLARLAA